MTMYRRYQPTGVTNHREAPHSQEAPTKKPMGQVDRQFTQARGMRGEKQGQTPSHIGGQREQKQSSAPTSMGQKQRSLRGKQEQGQRQNRPNTGKNRDFSLEEKPKNLPPPKGKKGQGGFGQILYGLLPSSVYNPETKKVFGLLETEDMLLVLLILLLAENKEENQTMLMLALAYLLLSDYIDLPI